MFVVTSLRVTLLSLILFEGTGKSVDSGEKFMALVLVNFCYLYLTSPKYTIGGFHNFLSTKWLQTVPSHPDVIVTKFSSILKDTFHVSVHQPNSPIACYCTGLIYNTFEINVKSECFITYHMTLLILTPRLNGALVTFFFSAFPWMVYYIFETDNLYENSWLT